ncbi:MAG: GNAT family N-acetyltransferase [Propionibacteriaceae bacterium]|nr:GNAT family N-acetyltransferase [Propionibacteriaceae bacterium]
MNITHRSFIAPDTVTDDLRGWYEAVGLGFGQSRTKEESLARWHADIVKDGWRFDGAHADAAAFGLGEHTPIATFATMTQSINTGGGHITPACFITDVTVRTTHRRRGLLTTMMTNALRRARDEGLALAALTVTEGGIYGRFGFGVATTSTAAELDTGPRFQLARDLEPRVELATPEASVNARRVVFDAFHAITRGSHQRPAFYDDYLSGLWNHEKGGPDLAVRSAVHLDADGHPDGVVSYAFESGTGLSGGHLVVHDLIASNAEAELGLWQFLGSIDLAEKVVVRRLSPASPLHWALADPHRLRITKVSDFTWLRVLDVPLALSSRGFESDGEVTFTVDDRVGLAAGSYRLVVRDGQAEVTPVSGANLRLDVRALGSLHLGLADAHVLAGAGQIKGPDADVDALAQLFRTALPPVNAAGF